MFDFSSTQWNMIDLAGRRRPGAKEDELHWEEAWSHLTRKYRSAFEYTVRDSLRRFGGGAIHPDQAGDVVQGFLASCVERGWLLRASPRFGRFRAFVFTLLRRYTQKQVEAARAQKRFPVGGYVPLDELLALEELATAHVPGHDTLDEWVQCLVAASVDRVRRRSPDNARALDLAFQHPTEGNAELASLLGWSVGKFTVSRHRGLKMLQEEIRHEVGQTVRDARTHAAEMELLAPFIDARTAVYAGA